MSSLSPVFRLSRFQKMLITSFTVGLIASFVYLIWLNSQLSQLIQEQARIESPVVHATPASTPPIPVIAPVPAPMPVIQSSVKKPSPPPKKNIQKNYFSKNESALSQKEQSEVIQAQAVEWIKQGRALDAEKLLLDYLKNQEESENIRECLVKLYFKQERLLESEQVLLAGIQKQPQVTEYFLLLSRLYHQQERYDDAVGVLQKLPEAVRNQSDAVTLLASCYYETELYKEAVEQYSKLVNLSTEQPRGWLGLALSQEALGQKSAALDYYRKTISFGNLEPSVIRFVKNKIAGLSRNDQNHG